MGYGMAWWAWHSIYYGLAGMLGIWYDLAGKVYGIAHVILYGMAWQT